MKGEFWHERWRRGEIGFHKSEVNPYLQRHWPRLKGASGSPRILVPCCGKSRDLAWLAEQGARVVGIELSNLAVESFFAESGLEVEVEHRHDHDLWRTSSIEILRGDLFAMTPDIVGPVDGVFDRGALVAMPDDGLRDRYSERLRALTGPATTLLVTLDYPSGEMDGPPFAIDEAEVRRRYAPARIECLERENIIAREPFFQERGLSRLTESAYLIEP